ncbi:MAG: PadR family transcriptional regulator [Sarcina sp.]
MNYNDLFKKSLDNDIFDKDKMFSGILQKIEEEKLKENLTVLLLVLIARKDSYGFELFECLDTLLKKKLKNKEGTIYPILHLLENKNYIKSYWSKENATKKYYTVTSLGKKFIAEKEDVVEYLKKPNQFIYKENFSWI